MEKYRNFRNKLLQELSKKEDLSESALDSALKTAVFECVDIPKRRDKDPDIRLRQGDRKAVEISKSPCLSNKSATLKSAA